MSGLNYKFRAVMVIDDNPIDLYIAGKLMTKHHFSENVFAYESAEAALAFLVKHQNQPEALPEIILVDIYMPGMSGFEFLEAYDKLSPTLKQYCRVYVVSSSIDEYDIRRVNENPNAVGFGVKTITRDFLDKINVI